jgi:dTDP-4-dehydrorhamnose 3,5-epimerase
MKFIETPLSDVILIEPTVYGDSRGFFCEVYNAARFAEQGIQAHFIQENHSGSGQSILRGLHLQARHPQGKLVRVAVGEVYDLVVDLRLGSPTYGHWYGTNLSAENRLQLWIPPGFAHGFYVLSEWAEFLYKVTEPYDPASERTLRWNDASLNIPWPLLNGQPPKLSVKDQHGLSFADLFVGVEGIDPIYGIHPGGK